MYIKRFFNPQTGQLKTALSPKESRELMEKFWIRISEEEYDRILLAIEHKLATIL